MKGAARIVPKTAFMIPCPESVKPKAAGAPKRDTPPPPPPSPKRPGAEDDSRASSSCISPLTLEFPAKEQIEAMSTPSAVSMQPSANASHDRSDRTGSPGEGGGHGDRSQCGPALSVLIPAFNVAEYVEECLASVLSQDFADFEVLVVDDGSTDGTFAKLERLAARDGRMTLLRQDRMGTAAARNALLGMARGEWLYFCDADDVVRPGAFSRMVSVAEENNLDVLAFHGERFSDGAGPAGEGDASPCTAAEAPAVSPPVVSGAEFYAERIEAHAWSVFLWEKLFRADFVRRIGARFPGGSLIEDTVFVMRTVPWAGRVLRIGDVLYSHRLRKGSVSAAEFDRNNVPDYCAYLEELIGIARSGRLPERAAKAHARTILMCARRIRKYWMRLDAAEREKVLAADGCGVRWFLMLSTFRSDGEYRALKDALARKGTGIPRSGNKVPVRNGENARAQVAAGTPAGSADRGSRLAGLFSGCRIFAAKILRATMGRCLAFLLADHFARERKRVAKDVAARLRDALAGRDLRDPEETPPP